MAPNPSGGADLGTTVGVVIVAAGSGKRFGGRKQFTKLLGVPLLAWSIHAFLDHPGIRQVAVVLPAQHVKSPPAWLASLSAARVPGGEERSDSVRNGLMALDVSCDIVLVHDGARPLVSRDLIDRVLTASGDWGVIPAVPATDTLKEVDAASRVTATLDRSRIWMAQTPQSFPLATLKRVHAKAQAEGVVASDDAGLFEWAGLPVHVVEGDSQNLKVTTQFDLAVAEAVAGHLPIPPSFPGRAKSGYGEGD